MSAPTTTRPYTGPHGDGGDLPPVAAGVADGRPPRLAVAVAVLAVVGALVAALVAVGDGSGWRLVDGAVVTEDGAELAVDQPLPEDVVLVAGDAGARVALPGADAELAAGTRLVVRGRVLVPETGALLVGAELRSVTVALPIGAASGRGTFRVDRGGVDRVASYDAALALDGDRPLAASRLDELVVDGGGVRLQPIRLDPVDPWDRRHAARALATDGYVQRLATGLAATYGDAPQPGAFYDDFTGVDAAVADALPDFAPTVTAAGYGPPADVLVAAAALDALVTGTGLSLAGVGATTLEERAAGATWGVVLARADLDDEDLRRAADAALRRRAELGTDATPLVPSSPSGGQDAPGPSTPQPSSGGQPGSGGGTGNGPGSGPGTGPGADPGDGPAEPRPDPGTQPPPGDGGGDGDDDPDDDPVDELLEDLDDATDPVLDLLEDPTGPVDELLDGDDDLLGDDGAAGGLLGGSGSVVGADDPDDADDADGSDDDGRLLGGLLGTGGALLDVLLVRLAGGAAGTGPAA